MTVALANAHAVIQPDVPVLYVKIQDAADVLPAAN